MGPVRGDWISAQVVVLFGTIRRRHFPVRVWVEAGLWRGVRAAHSRAALGGLRAYEVSAATVLRVGRPLPRSARNHIVGIRNPRRQTFRQAERIGITKRVTADIRIRIDPAPEANRITLQIPPEHRIIVAEAVVVQPRLNYGDMISITNLLSTHISLV